jgi:aldose 1-epimerase
MTASPALLLTALAAGGALIGCAAQPPENERSAAPAPTSTVTRAPFGATDDGRAVEIFTLANGRGMDVRTMPYGATIVSIRVPDRNGRPGDVVLGFDTFAEYISKKPPYFGAVVGRYGNRIAKGRFTLDGRTYTLATNNGPNHLHGGNRGFDKQLWHAEPFSGDDRVGVVYTLSSPDGDEGYPGTLSAKVTYTLTPTDELVVDYEASTDKATPVNLTQHTYFNLGGEGSGDILAHVLRIDADRFTPVDATLIPTGEIAPVDGTPFDFRTAAAIGSRIDADNVQLKRAGGYDHNWVLNRSGAVVAHAARLEDRSTGRTLDVLTTEPGLQFYSGNFLDGTIAGKSGHVYGKHAALCLETQHFPDSPNHPNFPTTIVRPGAPYTSRTVFAFGVTK